MGKKYKSNRLESSKNIQFNISNFNVNHYYLFIVTRYNNLLKGIKNLDSIKPNKEEVDMIEEEISNCICNNPNKKDLKVISIMPNFYNVFKEMKKLDCKSSEYAKNISNILNYLKNKNEPITLKKIAERYNYFYKIKISISTISRILKKHLNIRFLKTVAKNPKLEEKNYMIMSFVFLRCIIRSLELKLNLLFVDETGFLLENNNYFSWRNPDEEIYKGPKTKTKERLNLILCVSNSKVITKKFTKNPVDSKVFIEFLNDLFKELSEEEKTKTIIVMDNATFHISRDVVNFFKNNKLKGLTICPYRSSFNMIELTFRYVKNIIYKNVYSNLNDLQEDVIKILESKKLKMTLINLYKETLQKYKIFIDKNIDYKLN